MDRAVRRPAGDPALPQPRRRPLRPAPRHPVRDARDRRALRRGDEPLGDRDRPRRPRLGAVLHHGDRLPLHRRSSPTSRASTTFAGQWYHTGNWPHEGVDFTGQRVGVIGTGSSAIQSIPVIAAAGRPALRLPADAELQRPRAQRAAGPGVRAAGQGELCRASAAGPRVARGLRRSTTATDKSALEVTPEERQREYEARWQRGGLGFTAAFTDLLVNKEANDTAAEFVRAKIRAIVRDPAVAETLAPKDYPLGTKRLCVDTDYYETFNRDNVTLVDVRDDADRGDHPDGPADAGRGVRSSTASSSPPASTR